MTLSRSEIVTNYNSMTGKDYTSMLTIEWEALNKMMNEVKGWM